MYVCESSSSMGVMLTVIGQNSMDTAFVYRLVPAENRASWNANTARHGMAETRCDRLPLARANTSGLFSFVWICSVEIKFSFQTFTSNLDDLRCAHMLWFRMLTVHWGYNVCLGGKDTVCTFMLRVRGVRIAAAPISSRYWLVGVQWAFLLHHDIHRISNLIP